jgi:hypothetical protein
LQWDPLQHDDCAMGEMMTNIMEGVLPDMDQLLLSKPFLLALAWVLDLEFRNKGASDLSDHPLGYDIKTLSRQHYFTTVGVGEDPGNTVLSCMLFMLMCRSGAWALEHVKELSKQCKYCKGQKPDAMRRLCASPLESKPEYAQALLVMMQQRFSSVCFEELICNQDEARDIVEAIGGVMHPWKPKMTVVINELRTRHDFSLDEIQETRQAMGKMALASRKLVGQAYDQHWPPAKCYAAIMNTLQSPNKLQWSPDRCFACSIWTLHQTSSSAPARKHSAKVDPPATGSPADTATASAGDPRATC